MTKDTQRTAGGYLPDGMIGVDVPMGPSMSVGHLRAVLERLEGLEEVAERLGITVSGVKFKRQAGTLPAPLVIRRGPLWLPEQFRET